MPGPPARTSGANGTATDTAVAAVPAGRGSVGASEPTGVPEPSGEEATVPSGPSLRSTTGTDWVGVRTGVAEGTTEASPMVCPACTSASIRAASSAVGRSAGSLAISAASTGPSGPARRDSGSGSSTTAASVVIGESRRNGDCPSTAAYSVAPRPHRSEAGPGRSPWARSGAR